MGELFRSALSYLGGAGGPGGGGKDDRHDLIGQTVEVGGLKLRVRSLIAEGGYALVFAATDAQGSEFALKRLLAADREAADGILKEIRFLRMLTGHANIIRYVQACSLSPQESGHGRAEYLVLTELCTGGPVVDAILKAQLTPSHVLRIFAATCRAVAHMHAQSPLPITHRDLKAENLLLDSQGHVKLCDFGSSTTETFLPGPDWSANQRSTVEEEMARNTTPMYRAPELLDLYLDYPIGPPLDIWALGCMLYYLSYGVHPFEDSAKLRIINANFALPERPGVFEPFNPLIVRCLQVDPRARPSIGELVESVEALAVALGLNLDEPLLDLMPPGTIRTPKSQRAARPPPPTAGPTRPPPPSRPAPPKAPPPSRSEQSAKAPSSAPPDPSMPAQDHAETGSGLFGSMMRGSGSLFKNLKDTSAKIGQAVSTSVGAKGVDFTYVTSRLAFAPVEAGVPELVLSGVEEQLRHFLEARHKDKFAVYNLGQRKMKWNFDGRLSEVSLGSGARPPSLHSLFLIAKNVALWLRQGPDNLAVLAGPENYVVMVSAAFLIYARLVHNSKEALELIASRRSRPHIAPSFLRYLDYVAELTRAEGERTEPHNRPLQLVKLRVEPLPLFNRAKSGCRPFLEVHANGEKALSTSQEYEKLRAYELPESRSLDLELGIGVCGDVSLALFHARSTLGAKVQGRFAGLPILRVSFHTALVRPGTTVLEFLLPELDDLDEEPGKYGERFRLHLEVLLGEKARPFESGEAPAFWAYDPTGLGPKLLTSGQEEREQISRSLGIKAATDHSPELKRSTPPNEDEAAPAPGNFLHTLDWNAQHVSKKDSSSASGSRDASPLPPRPPPPHKRGDAEQAERDAGIRVGTGRPETPVEEEIPAEPEPEVGDLLNLGGAPPVPTPPPAEAPKPFDPFAAAFGETTATATSPTTTPSQHGLDDLFGNLSTAPPSSPPKPSKSGGDLLEDWTSANVMSGVGRAAAHGLQAPQGLPRNLSSPAFGSGVAPQPRPSTPVDPFAGLVGGPPGQPSQWRPNAAGKGPLNSVNSAAGSGSNTPTMQRPNYSRSAVASAMDAAVGVSAKPKVSGMEFDDLLSSQGFAKSAASTGPQTIAQMVRKEEAKSTDPEVLRVRDWTKGKERNIRALIGTLHEVVWEGNKWSQLSMGELLTPAQIKKHYRKACLAVHPDKQQGTPYETLAKLIFTELNDAYTEYQNAGEPSF